MLSYASKYAPCAMVSDTRPGTMPVTAAAQPKRQPQCQNANRGSEVCCGILLPKASHMTGRTHVMQMAVNSVRTITGPLIQPQIKVHVRPAFAIRLDDGPR